jgi:hypothetical protein
VGGRSRGKLNSLKLPFSRNPYAKYAKARKHIIPLELQWSPEDGSKYAKYAKAELLAHGPSDA